MMNGSPVEPGRRRSRRDWAVDICLFLLAVTYAAGWALWLIDNPAVPQSVVRIDLVISAVGCAALWLRRRWPVGLALALVPLSTIGEMGDGAALVALFTVAVHRPLKVTVVVGAVSVLSMSVYTALVARPDFPVAFMVLLTAAVTFAVIGWGQFIRHRRQLVLSLRERAVRAEAEARLRAEQSQHRAREQIAREMHDVLGHRLSLLSVHAGALEYRPDAPAGEIARAAGVIRASAHQALQDLREVIGVLCAPIGELPQPTLAEVRELVAESVRAGMQVDLHEASTGAVPDSLGRTAYRIVQEGLTNARKHAPGAEVTVTVTGTPGPGLTIEVRNAAAAGAGPDPGSGQGLIGLAERAALAGGRLEYGPTAVGGFQLCAWLPWPVCASSPNSTSTTASRSPYSPTMPGFWTASSDIVVRAAGQR